MHWFSEFIYSSSILFSCFQKADLKNAIFLFFFPYIFRYFVGIETLEIFLAWEKNSYQADALAISKYSLPLHQQKTVLLIATA